MSKFNGKSLKRNLPRFTTSDVKVTRWSPEARTRAKLRSSYGRLPEARQAVAVVRQAARGLARNGGPTEAGEAARVAQVDGWRNFGKTLHRSGTYFRTNGNFSITECLKTQLLKMSHDEHVACRLQWRHRVVLNRSFYQFFADIACFSPNTTAA